MRDLLFWCLMYLYHGVICLCRCLCGNRCICTGLIFTVADALLITDISAICFSLNLQILFSPPIICKCIYILSFLVFEDASFANFVSTSHAFYNLRMLLIEILHPQLALSMLCGCSPSKFCIFKPLESIIADIATQYPLLLFTSQLEPIHYLQKNDIRNSSEYGVSVGDT